MSDREEIERIRRIRERQLAARDPTSAERRLHQEIAARRKPKKITFWDVMQNIPAKWWGMILGGIVGFILALILDQILQIQIPNVKGFWVEYMWYSLVFAGIAVGRGLAMAMDWSEDDYRIEVKGR